MEFTIKDLQELRNAAKKILIDFKKNRVFAFTGELGAGKTTFIKAFCKELNVAERAVSPTFAIVNEYYGENPVYHIDLYRLNDFNEALAIGIEEYLYSGSYCFIEWPQLIKELLPADSIMITIVTGAKNERIITVKENPETLSRQ